MSLWGDDYFKAACAAAHDQINRLGPVDHHQVGPLIRRVTSVLCVDQIAEVSPATALFVIGLVGQGHRDRIDALRDRVINDLTCEEIERADAELVARRAAREAEWTERVQALEARIAVLERDLKAARAGQQGANRKVVEVERALTKLLDDARDAKRAQGVRAQDAIDRAVRQKKEWRHLAIDLMRLDDDGGRVNAFIPEEA